MTGAPLTEKEILEIRERIGAKGLALVGQVSDLRLMSGRQIQAVYFPADEHATAGAARRVCRLALSHLVSRHLLVRLKRRVGGVRAGSASYVYELGSVGHRLLDRERPTPRLYEPSAAFVDHQLAVSQLVVDLVLASRRRQLEIASVEGEPDCWRQLPALGRAVLRPDLFLALNAREYEYRWFVEVDRGTHHRPAILRKARLYESYYRAGVEQATHGVFPRVAWIAPDNDRADKLEELLSDSEFTRGLMIVTTSDRAPLVLGGGEA
jgi:hypothetical protein